MRTNIYYLTDDYGWHNYGIKRALYEELASREGIRIRMFDHRTSGIPLPNNLTHVFFASSGLTWPPKIMDQLAERGIKRVGFGFSDPRSTPKVFPDFDYYISIDKASVKLAEAAGIKALHQYPSVVRGYHDQYRSIGKKKLVFLGNVVGHPDQALRAKAITKLRSEHIHGLKGTAIYEQLQAYTCGLVVLGNQIGNSTIPKNIFEYAALGLAPVLAQSNNSHIDEHNFALMDDILGSNWATDNAFTGTVFDSPSVGNAAREYVWAYHTMDQRVDELLEFLGV